MRQNKYEYDAFISHAVEDKIPIANELCAKLERAGLKIWYSGKELGVGDSIEKTIERGLNRSRYGIVIFSPTYLGKNWTIREFYTLLAKEIEEQKVILPVLYNITLDELRNKDLVMADRFAVSADKGIDFIVDRLVAEIKKTQVVKRKEAWFSKIWLVLILSLLANVTFLVKDTLFSSAHSTAEVSLTSSDVGPRARPPVYHTLLGEMQGLFSEMGACTCNRGNDRDEPLLILSGFAQNVSNRSENSDRFGATDARVAKRISLQEGSKVTMAVVFQVEAPPPSAPAWEQTDEMTNTMSLEEEEEPFITLSSLESHRSQPSERSCHHTRGGN